MTSRGPTCTLILVKLGRLADFGAYIVIALAFAGIAILFANYNIRKLRMLSKYSLPEI